MKTTYTILLTCLALFSTAITCNGATPEIDHLSRQIDEERLAYQLYTELGKNYPQLRQFQNIPKAEKRHFNALTNYVKRSIPTLKTGTLTGSFIYPETKALYDKLLAEGSVSSDAALNVGVQVEELDIRDLDDAINAGPSAELKAIYENLRRGSVNHLAAFTGGKGGKQGKGGKNNQGRKGCKN